MAEKRRRVVGTGVAMTEALRAQLLSHQVQLRRQESHTATL